MAPCEMLSNEPDTAPPRVGSQKGRTMAPLLIGTLLLIVGIGNVWIAEGKTRYYESAFWRSTSQAPARGATRLIKTLPSKVSEYDSLAARRAHSRVEYYGMVAKFGYFLIVLGGVAALFSIARLPVRRSESSCIVAGDHVRD